MRAKKILLTHWVSTTLYPSASSAATFQAGSRHKRSDVNCSALAAFAHKLMNAALSRKSNTCVAAKVNLHIRKKIAKNLIIYYVNA